MLETILMPATLALLAMLATLAMFATLATCNGKWRHVMSMMIETTTKRFIIHKAESTHKYHHKYPLEIHSTRKKN